MIRVTWPDGHVTEARSWTWLMRRIQTDRWNRELRDPRAELAKRCYVWTGELVDPRLPAPEFWRALHDAGAVRLEVRPRGVGRGRSAEAEKRPRVASGSTSGSGARGARGAGGRTRS